MHTVDQGTPSGFSPVFLDDFVLLSSCGHDRAHGFENVWLFLEQWQKVFALDLDQDAFALADHSRCTCFTCAECHFSEGITGLKTGDVPTWMSGGAVGVRLKHFQSSVDHEIQTVSTLSLPDDRFTRCEGLAACKTRQHFMLMIIEVSEDFRRGQELLLVLR